MNAVLEAFSFGWIAKDLSAQVFGNVDLPHSITYVSDIAWALVTLDDAGRVDMGSASHVPRARPDHP